MISVTLYNIVSYLLDIRGFPDRLTWEGAGIIIGAGIDVFYREPPLARQEKPA